MNTEPKDFTPKRGIATIIRVAKERSTTRTVVALTTDLSSSRRGITVDYSRTGRTDGPDGLPSRLLSDQLSTLVGHSVQFTTAWEPDGHVRRVIGVRDLGIDPNFIAGDPRTPAVEPWVNIHAPAEPSATEVQFNGQLVEVYDVDSQTTAIRLDIGTDQNLCFLVHGKDDEAEAIRDFAQSLVGMEANIAGVAGGSNHYAASLLLTRIFDVA
jgi:hypothetical protein